MYSDYEITQWIDSKNRELRQLRRNWENLREEVPEKVNRLVREGFSTSASSYGSSNSIGMGLNFGCDTSAAKAYIAELRNVELPKYFNAISEAAIQIDKKLEELKLEGNSAVMGKLVNHLFDWIDFGENLTIKVQGTIRLTVNGLDHFKNKWSSYRGSAYSHTPVTSAAPAVPKKPTAPPKPARPVSLLRAFTETEKHAVWEVMAKPVLAMREQKLREILTPLQAQLDQISRENYDQLAASLSRRQEELSENRENTRSQIDSLGALRFRQKKELQASLAAMEQELAELQTKLVKAASDYEYALKCNKAAIEEEQESLTAALKELYPLPEEPGVQPPREKPKPRLSAVEIANNGYMDDIFEAMQRGRYYSREELCHEISAVAMLSEAKVMALVAIMKRDGRISSVADKGRPYYFIPDDAPVPERTVIPTPTLQKTNRALQNSIVQVLEEGHEYTAAELFQAVPDFAALPFPRIFAQVRKLVKIRTLSQKEQDGCTTYLKTPKAPPRPTAAQVANEGYKADILRELKDDRAYTVEEINKTVSSAKWLSFAKVNSLVQQLVDEEKMVLVEVKGKTLYSKV